MLRVLDLFSGIGGFSLGLERTGGFRTVAFCEIDPYCRAVLAKHWPGIPIHEDVRQLTAEQIGAVDVVCGGYPCQPFSNAGKRLGKDDDRHLWPEYRRLIEALRPAWVIGENVAGHISMGLDDVLSDLDALGYSWRPFVIPACAVDARHRRERVWILGHAEELQRNGGEHYKRGNIKSSNQVSESGNTSSHEDVADSSGAGLQGATRTGFGILLDQTAASQGGELGGGSTEAWRTWTPEPDVGRVAHGVPSRVDRLRALGNAVVPQIPEIIGHAILEAERLTL